MYGGIGAPTRKRFRCWVVSWAGAELVGGFPWMIGFNALLLCWRAVSARLGKDGYRLHLISYKHTTTWRHLLLSLELPSDGIKRIRTWADGVFSPGGYRGKERKPPNLSRTARNGPVAAPPERAKERLRIRFA